MVDKIDKEQMASQYGFALAFMHSDPELWHLFNQATKQTWTADRFVAKLRATDWFQKHSANVRNAIMQETSDPATYQANVDQMYSTVRDAWGSMFGAASMSNEALRGWAETAHRMGWSQAQLVDHMTKTMDFKKQLKSGSLGGTAAAVSGQIDSLVNSYGVDLGKEWKARQVKRLVTGDDTIDGVQSRIRELAMREYKAFSDQIAGGQSVADIADPYIQKMASLLEVDPSTITVNDKLVQKALKQRTPDGKPAAMDLTDFGDAVRQDARWQYTDNARQDMSSVVANLAQSFGAIA